MCTWMKLRQGDRNTYERLLWSLCSNIVSHLKYTAFVCIVLSEIHTHTKNIFWRLYTFSFVLYIFQTRCLSEIIPLSVCVLCVCPCVCESYQHRVKHSVFDGTPRSSLIFPIDFLLLSFLHSQGMGCLNWSWLVKESVSDRQTDRR